MLAMPAHCSRLDAASGRVLREVPLSGAPDVIFLHPQSGHLYVAIGAPVVIDVIDIGTMRCEEVMPTEAGAHTPGRNSARRFSPSPSGSPRSRIAASKACLSALPARRPATAR